jgi:transaldolase
LPGLFFEELVVKIFLDSADRKQIEKYLATGLIDGVTTNPSLLATQGANTREVITDILRMVPGDVSIEVVEKNPDAVYAQAHQIAKLGNNAVVKIPFAFEYLPVVAKLVSDGLKLNITLVFNVIQALMVAKLGATYVSPFIGRLDDSGCDGMILIKDLVTLKRQYNFPFQILAASVRNEMHWQQAALLGADVATVPPSIIEGACKHPLTDAGIKKFDEDWQKLGKKNLLE